MSKRYKVPYTLVDLATLSTYELDNLVVPKYRDKYSNMKLEELRRMARLTVNRRSTKKAEVKLLRMYTSQRYAIPPTLDRFKAIFYRWILRGLSFEQTFYKMKRQYSTAEFFLEERSLGRPYKAA